MGGGYVILPILSNEFVEKRNLINQDELINYFTLSQSMPGIIAANVSMFVGYKLKGKMGAIIAMFGIITVPFFTISVLASTLSLLTKNSYIQSIFWGIEISVIALILLTVRELWQNSNKNLFFYIIFLLSLSSIMFFKLSPIKTILIFTILGVIYKRLTTLKEVK